MAGASHKIIAQTLMSVIVDDNMTAQQVLDAYIREVEKNGTHYKVPGVIRELERLVEEQERVGTLVIESPYELDEKTLEAIKAHVGKDAADVKTVVQENKSLIGGFTAQVNNMMFDGSTKRQLQELKQALQAT